ncbi:zinc finger protein 236-like [Phymastichus coffea]|uniref:zinc finger protein 236-like n=1 Tax=Phymastichus coffea TaxID=108790 RepID=UPI00273C1250|nr:zinc finger protein 236-like [Phymastichus coffea]XP_058789267.1 zinc finger protein 236-like [Phymastichus coffea]
MTDLLANNEIQSTRIYEHQKVDNIIINNNNNNNNNNNSKNNKVVIFIENEFVNDVKFEEARYLHKKFKKIATSTDIEQANENFRDTVIPQCTSIAETENEIESNPSIGFKPLNVLRKSTYSCPYCKLSCAKPSVLQKHIRAHTNERPYPCMTCGFAFKTNSNLYKHCRSRAHALKIESSELQVQSESSVLYSPIAYDQTQVSNSPQPSDDSDVSLSDSSSTNSSSTHTPPPCAQTMRPNRIYKPKFHTVLQQCKTDIINQLEETSREHIQQSMDFITDKTKSLIGTINHRSQKLLQRYHREPSKSFEIDAESRKRTRSEGSELPISENVESINKYENLQTTLPLASPGPLLGSTHLIDQPKRARFESNMDSSNKYTYQSRMNALQMFGGEVRIIAASGETKTMRVQTRLHQKSSDEQFDNPIAMNKLNFLIPETASVVVRSGLQSGGTMLRKQTQHQSTLFDSLDIGQMTDFASIIPRVEAPKFTSNLETVHLKPTNIIHAGRLIPFVPGIPGPQNLFSLTTKKDEFNSPSLTNSGHSSTSQILAINVNSVINRDTTVSKFVRPSTLPLKPGTFTPKRHHGITPTTNTLVLISPETPRPKKSYGQLFLNGHAYTYLGLKCSTRLFYCTLNKPQPMYVLQQQGLSMYSNWKICKETSPELELQYYDSRNRPYNYTLASSYYQDIITHSSQQPTTPTSPDSGLESDTQDKTKRIRIFDGGFESNEDYTYIRGRGRGRYVCEECGIRCKKPSMLKKHIRTHTDVRPYTCKYCAFSFKTKGNLTKHMKSKAHYKKCIELRITPVPTSVCDENIDKEALDKLVLTGASIDDTSSSEDESEADAEGESDESGNEEHEAAQSLLRLAARPRPNNFLFASKNKKLLGLLSSNRPVAYPYNKLQFNVINCAGDKIKCSIGTQTAIDLTTTKTTQQLSDQQSTAEILSGPVSGSKLLRTLVQSMERLPIKNCNWQVSEVTQDQMFRAYLTERHLMNSKLKQQYRTTVPSIKSVISELRFSREHKKTEVHHESYELKSLHQVNLDSILPARKVVVNKMGFTSSLPHKPNTELFQSSLAEEAKNVCGVCSKVFSKPSQLRLHINIHYFERPFRCESCGTSFRTKGHLTKHERSTLHQNKVNMTSTFGAATASNPRPFKCIDCKSAFRIHGHLAKHLRSKMHIMKLECLRKLPFGTYAEMEKSGINLNDIDTTDCDTSLSSLQIMAQTLYKKQPNQINHCQSSTIVSISNNVSEQTSILSAKSSEASESSSDEGGKDSTALIQSEINYPCFLINTCQSNRSNETSSQNSKINYQCHICTTSLSNLDDLKSHCFEEHRMKSSITSQLFCNNAPEFSKKLESRIINKENTQRLPIISGPTIKKDI